MADLAVQDATDGAVITFTAAAGGGDTIAQGVMSGGWRLPVVLIVKNADATAKTVTVAGMSGVSVPAAGEAVIPVQGGRYGVPRAITYSAVTSVTVAAVRLTDPLE